MRDDIIGFERRPDVFIENMIALEKITPKMMLEYFTKRIIGQDKELRLIVYMFYNYLISVFNKKEYSPPRWILTAPSGCGKTEVFRTLRDFCKDNGIRVPVVQIDLSQYTETGFSGKNSDEIMITLHRADPFFDGIGFCFLDEADKTFVPSHNSDGEDCNAAAQSNLLMLIEGKSESLQVSRTQTVTMDSGKTMFILMGAFQEIRNQKQTKLKKAERIIGFNCIESPGDHKEIFYEDITLSDMIEFGMLEELAGRLQLVINLHKLSREDMIKVIISKISDLEYDLKMSVVFDDSVTESLLNISYSNLGLRKVINCLKELAYRAVSDEFYDKKINNNCCLVIDSADKAHLEFEGSSVHISPKNQNQYEKEAKKQ